MRLADQMLPAQIREALLGHIPDQQWALVEQEVEKAGGVDKVDGYTGVLLRDAIEKAKKNKVETVMSEFKAGKLKSSSGKKVKSRKQAIAIALSEQRRVKKEMLEKASFGGDRSAAGRYAAEQRWKGHAKSDKPSGTRAMGPRNTKYNELANRRRSLDDDIKYNQENINRMYQEQAQLGIGDERRMQQIQDVISRLETVTTNLTAKRDAIQAQMDKEFPERVEGTPENSRMTAAMDEASRITRESNERQAQSDKPSKEERDAKKIKMMSEGAASQPKPEKVAERKAQMSRDEQGVVNWKGMTRGDIQEALEGSLEELRAVQTGELSPMRWGRIRSKKLALTEIVDMISDTRSMLQAMDEFEDETSPGYFAS